MKRYCRCSGPHQDNCVRAFHCGRLGCSGYPVGKMLIRHYDCPVPDEIVLKPVMFLKVRDRLADDDAAAPSP